ncbi:hypothetical protein MRX96_041904 [Rhipicephalus microplus]
MKHLLTVCVIGALLCTADAILKGLALGALGLGTGFLLGSALANGLGGGGGGGGGWQPYPMAWHGGSGYGGPGPGFHISFHG